MQRHQRQCQASGTPAAGNDNIHDVVRRLTSQAFCSRSRITARPRLPISYQRCCNAHRGRPPRSATRRFPDRRSICHSRQRVFAVWPEADRQPGQIGSAEGGGFGDARADLGTPTKVILLQLQQHSNRLLAAAPPSAAQFPWKRRCRATRRQPSRAPGRLTCRGAISTQHEAKMLESAGGGHRRSKEPDRLPPRRHGNAARRRKQRWHETEERQRPVMPLATSASMSTAWSGEMPSPGSTGRQHRQNTLEQHSRWHSFNLTGGEQADQFRASPAIHQRSNRCTIS